MLMANKSAGETAGVWFLPQNVGTPLCTELVRSRDRVYSPATSLGRVSAGLADDVLASSKRALRKRAVSLLSVS